MTVRPLEAEQTQLMEGQMLVAEPQRRFRRAAQLLSSLSRSPGRAVSAPCSTFRHVEFCGCPTVER